jgi:hypothetical protein
LIIDAGGLPDADLSLLKYWIYEENAKTLTESLQNLRLDKSIRIALVAAISGYRGQKPQDACSSN